LSIGCHEKPHKPLASHGGKAPIDWEHGNGQEAEGMAEVIDSAWRCASRKVQARRQGMKSFKSLGLAALVLSGTVQAASFDCAKAQSKVEKMICADAELSKLDEEMARAYATSLQDKSRANAARQTQRQWVKERNKCADAICVRESYQAQLQALSSLGDGPRQAGDKLGKPQEGPDAATKGGALAGDSGAICSAIAGLWLDGSFRRYAVPFEQTTPDELIYKVDIDSDGRIDEIRALCGNGADASCEITASFEGPDSIEFGLPAGIRLLKFRKSVYIVNGVLIGHTGDVRLSGYMVHKVSKRGIELICQTKS